jgi:hypothetical protein
MKKAKTFTPFKLAINSDTHSDISRQVGAKQPDDFLDIAQCFQQATAEGGPAIRVERLRANIPGICHYNNSSW